MTTGAQPLDFLFDPCQARHTEVCNLLPKAPPVEHVEPPYVPVAGMDFEAALKNLKESLR